MDLPEQIELPDGFADLAPFVAQWCLPDSQARMHMMSATRMGGLRAFYDAMLPRVDAIVAHLNRFPVDDMPPAERHLLDLALTFAEVAHPVDLQWTATHHEELFDADRINLIGPSRAW